jgi:hypothetical protein
MPTELLALKTNLADTRAEQFLDDFAIAETTQFTNPKKVFTEEQDEYLKGLG